MQNNNTSYGIKINLLSLDGVTLATLRGQHATKPCIIIPLDSGLHEGARGVYLNLNAVPRTDLATNGWTHLLRLNLPPERYNAMDEAQRAAIPSVGIMRQLGARTLHTPTEIDPQLTLLDPTQLSF